MSALADRPEEEDNNKDDDKKDKLPSFSNENKIELPIEKQLSHRIFLDQIQTISLDDAKQLLDDLHRLYLNQQYVVSKIAKQEFLANM